LNPIDKEKKIKISVKKDYATLDERLEKTQRMPQNENFK
jgi:hypothetical protein